MQKQSDLRFVTQDGQTGVVEPLETSSKRVRLRLENGSSFLVPTDFLQEQGDGSFYLPVPLEDPEDFGPDAQGNARTVVVVPVVREDLVLRRQEQETGRVKISKRVQERTEVVDEPVFNEYAEVERVPVDRVLDEPATIRYEGNTLIIPVMEEVLVVEKRLMLREEIRVTRRREEKHQPQEITLRKEQVFVDHDEENRRDETGGA